MKKKESWKNLESSLAYDIFGDLPQDLNSLGDFKKNIDQLEKQISELQFMIKEIRSIF